ncbi:hypothetical protein SPAR61_1908 [Streptococcus pneumoniae GA19998]|nr:hypothetical protein SPAR61_1908 [Streptococcus pneumoniae GA19998]
MSIPFIPPKILSLLIVTVFDKKCKPFILKNRKKLSNDYHEINTGNQSNFYENVKDNEIKYFLTKVSNLFFKEFLMKQSKTINLKLAH